MRVIKRSEEDGRKSRRDEKVAVRAGASREEAQIIN